MLDIKKVNNELLNSLDYYETLKEAWERVERVHTKAGKDFKIISKNFTNCRIDLKYYVSTDFEKTVHVYGTGKRHGNYSISDDIDIYKLVPKWEVEGHPEIDRIESDGFYHYYMLTIDEIWEAIQSRIKALDKLATETRSELESLENNFNKIIEINEALREAMKPLPRLTRSAINEQLKKEWYY